MDPNRFDNERVIRAPRAIVNRLASRAVCAIRRDALMTEWYAKPFRAGRLEV